MVLPKTGNSLDANKHTVPMLRSMIDGTLWELAGRDSEKYMLYHLESFSKLFKK